MPTDDLAELFRRMTGERSVRAIALRTGLDQTTLTRQLAGRSTITIETVVTICREYGLDFATVFVEVGFITEEEAQSFGQHFELAHVSDLELSKEIVRRLNAGSATAALTEPMPDALVDEVLAETPGVTPIRPRPSVGASTEDLAEVASESINHDPDDTDDKYDA